MTSHYIKKACSLALFVLIPLVLLTAQTTETAVLNLEKSYRQSGIVLEIDELLEVFRAKLLDRSILTKAELDNPSAIYKKLGLIENTVVPRDFQIDQLVPKAPFSDVLDSFDFLKASQEDQVTIALFTYYQIFSEKHAQFELYLNDRRLVEFNGADLPINSFEGILFDEIASRGDRNVKPKDVKFIIKADPQTPTEFVNFIARKLRDMSIRRIKFERK